MENEKAGLERMQRAIDETLNPLIPRGSVVAIFDFPNHSNVGDSAIWLGEMAYLKKRCGSENIFVYGSNFYQGQFPEFKSDTIILISGGGNLGDLWPKHQQLRQSLIANYKKNTVIQLPQSIHFEKDENAETFGKIVGTHSQVYILLRDAASKDLCGELNERGKAILCPDMALYMGELTRAEGSAYDALALLRKDREGNIPGDELAGLRSVGPVKDWLGEPFSLTSSVIRVVNRLNRVLPLRSRLYQKIMLNLCERVAKKRVDRGIEMLCSGDVIVSDRLHVHILCCMLRKPHIIIDNCYRKIGNFDDTWKIDTVTYAYADGLTAATKILGEWKSNSRSKELLK